MNVDFEGKISISTRQKKIRGIRIFDKISPHPQEYPNQWKESNAQFIKCLITSPYYYRIK